MWGREVAKTKSQLPKETKLPTRSSESVDGPVSGAAVLISAATLEEVQGHPGFNSWLSEFVSPPTSEPRKADDFSANLAKLKAAESNRASVLALEANGGGGWAQQVIPESIQKMLGTSMSGGAVHVILKDLVKPAWAEGKEKQVEEVLISPESTIFDLCEKISSKGINKDGIYVPYFHVTTVANMGLRLQRYLWLQGVWGRGRFRYSPVHTEVHSRCGYSDIWAFMLRPKERVSNQL